MLIAAGDLCRGRQLTSSGERDPRHREPVAARPQGGRPDHRGRASDRPLRRADRLGHHGHRRRRLGAHPQPRQRLHPHVRPPRRCSGDAPGRHRIHRLPAARRPGRHPRRRRGRVPRRVRSHRRRRDRRRLPTTCTSSASAAATRAPTPSECSSELCTHPNVGAVVLVSLGCEGLRPRAARRAVAASGRPVTTLVIQESAAPGRRSHAGRAWIETSAPSAPSDTPRPHRTDRPRRRDDLRWVGRHERHHREPRGRPGVRPARRRGRHGRLRGDGRADRLRAPHGQPRRHRRGSAHEIVARVGKAAEYYTAMGHGSFSPGNAEGGLTTLEEKSLGAYSKSGSGPIHGVVTPGQPSPAPGLYLLDVVPEGASALGLPEHQRQRRDRRADRLRRPRRAVHHRPRVGRRVGDLAGDQGLRQPRDVPAHARRHGRRRRAHPRRATPRSTRSPPN